MPAPELLDPAASVWTVSAQPLADVLADLDPADLLLALPVPTGGLPTSGAVAQGLALADVDRFLCHPGGMKVIEALETGLDLGQGALDIEREVLADHGNMRAPTAHTCARARG